MLIMQLTVASLMVVLTVLVHLSGLTVTMRLLRARRARSHLLQRRPLLVLTIATLGVFAVHTIEIWLFALLYRLLGSFNSFEEALYFSTVTYATIGYGDFTLPHAWRVLGAIEGATGVIMLGWSTAFLVSLLSQLKLLGHDWLNPRE